MLAAKVSFSTLPHANHNLSFAADLEMETKSVSLSAKSRDSGAMCDDNYSSEEELKEINDSDTNKKKKKVSMKEPSRCSTSEKRKWSEVSRDEVQVLMTDGV